MEEGEKMSKIKQLKHQKETMAKVLIYVKKYWTYITLSIILAAASVASTLYILTLIGDGIDCIIGVNQVDTYGLIKVLKSIGLYTAITALSQWGMNICNNKVVYNVINDIRKDAFEKIEILPLKYIDSKSYGEIVSRVIADVDQFADGLLMGFTQLFTGVITILGTLFFMFRENVSIAFIVVCLTPVSIFVASYIAKKTYSMFKLQSEIRGEQTAFVDEMIGNQKVVQAFSYEEEAAKNFGEINSRLEKASLHAIFYSSITNPATRFVNGLVYTGVGIFGAISVINGNLTVGVLTSFLNYANQYTKPFNEISGVITELQNALACAKRVFELIEEKAEVPDAPNAIELGEVKGNVVLNDVDFSYTQDKKFIEDLNIKVRSGQRIAIVGPTGCGKTTIINLLMRFYEIDKGSIMVDGYDIREVSRKSLRSNYGMVLQETWLKSGTIRENLIMGKPDATEDEIINAAKLAHVHGVIKRMLIDMIL